MVDAAVEDVEGRDVEEGRASRCYSGTGHGSAGAAPTIVDYHT